MSDEVAGSLALQSPMFIPGAVTSAINKLSPLQYLGNIFPGCHQFKAIDTASSIMVRPVVWLFLLFVRNTPLGREQLYLSWTYFGWGHHSQSHWGNLVRWCLQPSGTKLCNEAKTLCKQAEMVQMGGSVTPWVALPVRSALLLFSPSPGPLLKRNVYACWETGQLSTELWRPPWLLVVWRVQPTSCTGS